MRRGGGHDGPSPAELRQDVSLAIADAEARNAPAMLRAHMPALCRHTQAVRSPQDAVALAEAFAQIYQLVPVAIEGSFWPTVSNFLVNCLCWDPPAEARERLEAAMLAFGPVWQGNGQQSAAMLQRTLRETRRAVADFPGVAAVFPVDNLTRDIVASQSSRAGAVCVRRHMTGWDARKPDQAATRVVGRARCLHIMLRAVGDARVFLDFVGSLFPYVVETGVASFGTDLARLAAWTGVINECAVHTFQAAARAGPGGAPAPHTLQCAARYVHAQLSAVPCMLPSAAKRLGDVAKGVLPGAAADGSPLFHTVLDGVEMFVSRIAAPVDPDAGALLGELAHVAAAAAAATASPPGQCEVTAELLRRAVRCVLPSGGRLSAARQRCGAFFFGLVELLLRHPDLSEGALGELLRNPKAWVHALPAAGATGVRLVIAAAEHGRAVPPAGQEVQRAVLLANLVGALHKLGSGEQWKACGAPPWRAPVALWIAAAFSAVRQQGAGFGAVAPAAWFDPVWPLLHQLARDPASQNRVAALTAVDAALAAAGDGGLVARGPSAQRLLWAAGADWDGEVRWAALGAFARQSARSGLTHYPSRGVVKEAEPPFVFGQPLRPQLFMRLVAAVRGGGVAALRGIATAAGRRAAEGRAELLSAADALGALAVGAARYCVQERLRTPLGGAGQTFEELDKMIRSAAGVSLLVDENYERLRQNAKQQLAAHPPPPPASPQTVPQGDRTAFLADGGQQQQQQQQQSDDDGEVVCTGGGAAGGGPPLLRHTALLLMLGELERWVYLAQEGFGAEGKQGHNLWPAAASAFFMANRRVCDDYFNRIRVHTIAACDAAPAPMFESFAIRNCALRLQDMKAYLSHVEKKQDGVPQDIRVKVYLEMEKVLLSLCAVCVRRACADVVVGHRAFAKHLVDTWLFPPGAQGADAPQEPCVQALWTLLEGMAAHCEGHYEDALQCYEVLLTPEVVPHVQVTVLRFAAWHAIDCCIRTWAWQRLAAFAGAARQAAAVLQHRDTADTAASERKQLFLAKDVAGTFERERSSAATAVAFHMEYARALGQWDAGDHSACLASVANTDAKATALLTGAPRDGGTAAAPLAAQAALPPTLVARLRILHALVRACVHPEGDREALAPALRAAADRLQVGMAWEARAGHAELAHLLRSLAESPGPSVYHRAELTLFFHGFVPRGELGAGAGWEELYAESVLCAARAAREQGNLDYAARALARLSASSSDKPEPAAWSYERALLMAEGPQHKEGVQQLWLLVQDKQSELACDAMLHLHKLAGEEGPKTDDIAAALGVPSEQLGDAVAQALTRHFPGRREAWQRFADWASSNPAARTAEQPWIQAISSHCTALSLGGGTPLQDTQLALRVLQLLVQGAEAGCTLPEADLQQLLQTPPSAWREIFPQLLAHLTNPNPSVHGPVINLLHRVGREDPLVLLYPLIAVLNSPKGTTYPQFQQLWAATCDGESEKVYNMTRDFVSELVRITELLDEEAAGVIAALSHSLSRVIPSYKAFVRSKLGGAQKRGSEAHGASKFNLLKRQKYEALLQPLVQVLERLIQRVAAQPRCQHDAEFQVENLPRLRHALHALRGAELPLGQGKFDELVVETHAEVQAVFSGLGRTLAELDRRSHSLTLQDISPQLTEAQRTGIPVPGACTEGAVVRLQRMEQAVEVILSKTRPKKLQLWGDDGKRYTYLLKGKEDLSLDERVMQFLRVAAALLTESSVARARGLTCHSYAVVPLSDRSGLIRFVENVKPVFQLHRQWMRRKVAKDQILGQRDGRPTGAQPQRGPAGGAGGFRPVHQFFNVLLPALKQVGISNVGSRAEWPPEVLRKVFNQLTTEVPRDLLTRELWHRGALLSAQPGLGVMDAGVPQWFSRTRVFANSLAVMSIIGYIIGLGDRHLDNMLMDFDTGAVVHIDYNICFEKGLQLRVPEIVPFRLTHVLEHALGVQGLEGTFRLACEETLRVMRSHKDTLLALLEAFVHDPLVEWTSRRVREPATEMMEVRVALSVLSSQFDESLRDFPETVHSCAYTVQCLAQAVADYEATQQSELATGIRERVQRLDKLQEQIARLTRAKQTATRRPPREDLSAAYGQLDEALHQLGGMATLHRRHQESCAEARPALQRGGLLEPRPEFPGFEANPQRSARPSQAVLGRFDSTELPQNVADAAGYVEYGEQRLGAALAAHRQHAGQLADLLRGWARAVDTLHEGSPGTNYANNCYAYFFQSVCDRVLHALGDFSGSGSMRKAGYQSFVSAADAAEQAVHSVQKEVATERQVHSALAPPQPLQRVQCDGAELARDLERFAAEAAAVRESAQGGQLTLRDVVEANDLLNTTLDPVGGNGVRDPEAILAACYAAANVLSSALESLHDSVQQRPVGAPSQQTWERSLTLAQVEESDSPLLLVHQRWQTLELLRRAVAAVDRSCHLVAHHFYSEQSAAVFASATQHARIFQRCIAAMEQFVTGITPAVLCAVNEAAESPRGQVLAGNALLHYVSDPNHYDPTEVPLVPGIVKLFGALAVGLNELGPLLGTSEQIMLQRLLQGEQRHMLERVATELGHVLASTPATPLARHEALRQIVGNARGIVNALIEDFTFPFVTRMLEGLVHHAMGSLQQHATAYAQVHVSPQRLRGASAGPSAQGDVAGGLFEGSTLSPELQQHMQQRLATARHLLEKSVDTTARQRAGVMTETCGKYLAEIGHFDSVMGDLKRRAVNVCWLYEPLLPEVPPALLHAARWVPDLPLGRAALLAALERAQRGHAGALRDLQGLVSSLDQNEEKLQRLAGRTLPRDCTEELQRRCAERSRALAESIAHGGELDGAALRVMRLESMRCLSQENSSELDRVEQTIEACSTAFTHMHSTHVAVLYRDERLSDVTRELQQLKQQQRQLKDEADSLHAEIQRMKQAAHAATADYTSTLAEISPQYTTRVRAALQLLQGAERTLRQFSALGRLHQRVCAAVEQLQTCLNSFDQWARCFDGGWGPGDAPADPYLAVLSICRGGEGNEKERIAEAAEEFVALNTEAVQQLDDLATTSAEIAQGGDMPWDDETTRQAEQQELAAERSMHALTVLNRVQLKLEGRDNGDLRSRLAQIGRGGPGAAALGHDGNPTGMQGESEAQPLSVPEQVQSVIAQATSIDSLVLMYEGWTAWI